MKGKGCRRCLFETPFIPESSGPVRQGQFETIIQWYLRILCIYGEKKPSLQYNELDQDTELVNHFVRGLADWRVSDRLQEFYELSSLATAVAAAIQIHAALIA
jgi:hypothetical protein